MISDDFGHLFARECHPWSSQISSSCEAVLFSIVLLLAVASASKLPGVFAHLGPFCAEPSAVEVPFDAVGPAVLTLFSACFPISQSVFSEQSGVV